MINIRNFGTNLWIKESFSSKMRKEKQIFIEIVKTLLLINNRSIDLINKNNIDLTYYDNLFFDVIEDLLLLKYGITKTNIILWYIYERISEDGTINSITFNYVENGNVEEYILKNEEELWNLLLKLEE
jgi:hypothetical protein